MIPHEKLKDGDVVYGYWNCNRKHMTADDLRPVKGMITYAKNQRYHDPAHTEANFFIPCRHDAESCAYSQLCYEKACPIDDIYVEDSMERAINAYNSLLITKIRKNIRKANRLLSWIIPAQEKDRTTCALPNTVVETENPISKAKRIKADLCENRCSIDEIDADSETLIELVKIMYRDIERQKED